MIDKGRVLMLQDSKREPDFEFKGMRQMPFVNGNEFEIRLIGKEKVLSYRASYLVGVPPAKIERFKGGVRNSVSYKALDIPLKTIFGLGSRDAQIPTTSEPLKGFRFEEINIEDIAHSLWGEITIRKDWFSKTDSVPWDAKNGAISFGPKFTFVMEPFFEKRACFEKGEPEFSGYCAFVLGGVTVSFITKQLSVLIPVATGLKTAEIIIKGSQQEDCTHTLTFDGGKIGGNALFHQTPKGIKERYDECLDLSKRIASSEKKPPHMSETSDIPGKEISTSPKKTKSKRGRPKSRNLKKDQCLMDEWTAAKDAGTGRGSFCEDRAISIRDLDNARRNVDRIKNSKK